MKDNKGVCERLNLSVKMTDEFYEKLKTEPNSPHYVKQKNGLEFILEDDGKPVTVKQFGMKLSIMPGSVQNLVLLTKMLLIANVL